MDPVTVFFLPIGLGLLGFVEPCSIGSSLLFIKYIEGRSSKEKAVQTGTFVMTRALVIGAFGAVAAIVGTAFIDAQKFGWLLLGALYAVIGLTYLVGKAGILMRGLGPSLRRLAVGQRGAAGLGLLFGVNIPACAAPLLFAVLGAAAVGGGEGLHRIGTGFLSLALFGLALSAPLVLAIAWAPARLFLDRAVAWSAGVPRLIGAVFILLGLWSIYFGFFVTPRA